MEQSAKIGLDNEALRSRVRGYVSRPLPTVQTRLRQLSKQKIIADYNYSPPKHFSEYFQPQSKTVEEIPSMYFPIPQSRLKNILGQGKRLTAMVNKSYALLTAAALFIVLGGYLGVAGFKSNQRIETQAQALGINAQNQGSSSELGEGASQAATQGAYDETPVTFSAQEAYTVAPDMPRLLKIPVLGVSARVKRVTVDSNNVMGAPSNIYDVGWYDGGAKPGEPGAMFIDGHVSGPNDHGSFYDIKKLKAGDELYVESGDFRNFVYVVTATEWFDANNVDMAKVLRAYDSTKPGLNLMTCGGRFNNSTQQYEQRVVVYAVLQNTL
jgi:LPXTG-site transpeptidase (sortase) family protein